MRKILRRQEEPALLSSGDITVDLGKGEVRKQGELLALSGTEQRLLLCFLEHPGQLLTKGQLLERIWDCEGSYVDENTLAVAIRRLRVKIEEDPGEPRRIRTVHGQGYLWPGVTATEKTGEYGMGEMWMLGIASLLVAAAFGGFVYFRRRYFQLYQRVQLLQQKMLAGEDISQAADREGAEDVIRDGFVRIQKRYGREAEEAGKDRGPEGADPGSVP